MDFDWQIDSTDDCEMEFDWQIDKTDDNHKETFANLVQCCRSVSVCDSTSVRLCVSGCGCAALPFVPVMLNDLVVSWTGVPIFMRRWFDVNSFRRWWCSSCAAWFIPRHIIFTHCAQPKPCLRRLRRRFHRVAEYVGGRSPNPSRWLCGYWVAAFHLPFCLSGRVWMDFGKIRQLYLRKNKLAQRSHLG